MMSNTLFTPEELLKCESVATRHRRVGASVLGDTLVASGQAVLLGLVIRTEYSLFKEIFDYTKGPALPGEGSTWSTGLLAMTGTLMMAGYHVYAQQHPRSIPVQVIERLAGAFLPIYALGAGLAVASITYFDGADSLVTQVANAGRDLFATSEATTVPLLDRLLSMSPMIFSIGCGGLAVVNLTVAHHLVSGIQQRISRAWCHALAALEASNAIKTIRAAQRKHNDLVARRNALAAMGEGDHKQAVANDVIDVINEAIRPYENHLIDLRIRGAGPDNRFAAPTSNLDPKELAKRVAALKAITTKTVLTALRDAKEQK